MRKSLNKKNNSNSFENSLFLEVFNSDMRNSLYEQDASREKTDIDLDNILQETRNDIKKLKKDRRKDKRKKKKSKEIEALIALNKETDGELIDQLEKVCSELENITTVHQTLMEVEKGSKFPFQILQELIDAGFTLEEIEQGHQSQKPVSNTIQRVDSFEQNGLVELKTKKCQNRNKEEVTKDLTEKEKTIGYKKERKNDLKVVDKCQNKDFKLADAGKRLNEKLTYLLDEDWQVIIFLFLFLSIFFLFVTLIIFSI